MKRGNESMIKLNEIKNNKEELKKVFEENTILQEKVLEDMRENDSTIVDDYLYYFKNHIKSWSLGSYGYTYGYNYIKVDPGLYYEFLEDCIRFIKDYDVLEGVTLEFLQGVKNKVNELYTMDYDNKQYENLESWIDEKIEFICESLTQYFSDILEYDYNDDEIFDYFYEFYVENRIEANRFYVNEGYELIEVIEKSYK